MRCYPPGSLTNDVSLNEVTTSGSFTLKIVLHDQIISVAFLCFFTAAMFNDITGDQDQAIPAAVRSLLSADQDTPKACCVTSQIFLTESRAFQT